MMRASAVWLSLLVLVTCTVLARPADTEKRKKSNGDRVRTKLSRLVSTTKIEAGTPVKDVLDYLADKFDVTIVMDVEAFKRELQLAEPESHPVKLPRTNQISLHSVLRLLCDQMMADYYVQPDGLIYLVPVSPSTNCRVKQPVAVRFEGRPLDEALSELQKLTHFSVVLDKRRAGNRARLPITVLFRDVPLNTAVSMLADLADLKAILIDNAYFVTSAQRADELQKELDAKHEFMGSNGLGLSGLPSPR